MPGPLGSHGTISDSWWSAVVPTNNVVLAAATWIGGSFTINVPGRIFGMRFYCDRVNDPPRLGVIWIQSTGLEVAARQFRADKPVALGWMNCWLHPTVRIDTTQNYYVAVLKYHAYLRSNAALAVPVTHGNIKFNSSFQTTAIDPPVATLTSNTNANGVDLLFMPD